MRRQLDSSLETLISHAGTPQGIKNALVASNGSRFVRCAFQVNPFAYGTRHANDSGLEDEEAYNQAMLDACLANGVEVVALTDHFRFEDCNSLRCKLEEGGIHVFPGFEANSLEGVHVLCLFSPKTTNSEMIEYIGACDIRNRDDPSPISKKSFEEILALVHERGGISIAAHVTSNSGLLKTPSGQTRLNAWKSQLHLASAIPGPVSDVPSDYRQICLNKDDAYKRERPVAFLNASDVSRPEDFAKPGSTTMVKMTEVSIEGLRQAFLDGESRVMLNSDATLDDFTRIIALAWDGGLLDGQWVALNAGLNVMIGGRGAGKSTIVESLRFAFHLTPLGKDSGKSHASMMKHLLGARSEVSVVIFSPTPSPGYYLVERAYGGDAKVKNQVGDIVTDLKPTDVLPGLEVYGQHEISEITRDKRQLAELLERFVSVDSGETSNYDQLPERFRASRKRILDLNDDIEKLDLALTALPGLKEKLKRYEDTDVATRLGEQSSIQTEERILDGFAKQVSDIQKLGLELKPDLDDAPEVLPSGDEVELPHREDLAVIETIAADLHSAKFQAAKVMTDAAEDASEKLNSVRSDWQSKADAIAAKYNSLKKELEKEGNDPDAYLSIKKQVEQLEPKQGEKERTSQDLLAALSERKGIVDEWEKADRAAYRALEKAAKKVSKKLSGTVRASVRPSSDLGPLEDVLRDGTSGPIAQAISRLQELDDLSPSKLANTIRNGAQALCAEFGFTDASAQKIAAGGEQLALLVEETRIPPEAIIELNVGPEGQENWKELDRLSAGQKATAVLMLLLLESDAPLVIDQPEDDLDNHFIAGHVVRTMRTAKKQRQFLFSSHNPNIPVLGDADQIIGLTPVVEDGSDRTKIEPELCGSIDKADVQELIKELLEGGRQAFTTRRTKYGF